VDLLFFDTTSTYFELEEPDEPVARDEKGNRQDATGEGEGDQGPDGADAAKPAGFRTHGKSKDSRDDLPQIVIGMAVTRDGIPVRVWSWPGNASDQTLIRQVKDDMRDWTLSKIDPEGHRGTRTGRSRTRSARASHHLPGHPERLQPAPRPGIPSP
jgi:hypothetical protein